MERICVFDGKSTFYNVKSTFLRKEYLEESKSAMTLIASREVGLSQKQFVS